MKETAIEFLRRAVTNLDYEPEDLLQQLPTPESLLEYFRLWDVYGTEYLEGILECIAEGDDPAPFDAFVRKHKLKWRRG